MSEFDPSTGEVYPNGARATAAAAQGRMMMRDQQLGVGQIHLNDAVERAMNKIPLWITHDAEASVTERTKVGYATLKQILTVVRPPLAEFGVRIRQGAERSFALDDGSGTKGRLVPVYTDLVHTPSGEVDRTIIEMPLTRMDPKAMSSAITYGQRKSLLCGLGLATDEADDDGNSAMPRDLVGEVRNSTEYEATIAAMKSNRSQDALRKWVADSKTKAAINRLNEAESERLRIAFAEWRNELPEAEPKASKP